MSMEEEVNTLVRTIDDAPDPLHSDVTPSVIKLIDKGLLGVRAVLPLLSAPGEATRQRASRVLEGAVARHFGFREGSGFPDAESEQSCRRALQENEPVVDTAEGRVESAAKWRNWLNKQ